MKRLSRPLVWLVFGIMAHFSSDALAQFRARTEPYFPDIYGYVTLKCDFHMHTVFSDGLVWPTVRTEEAWRQGLDVFALTDHIEYTPHKDDVPIKFGRPHDLARPGAEALNLVLIKAAEITRGEPPGHWNALFVQDINALKTEKYPDAVKAAIDQGAFLFWNHPGWKQPKGKSVWYKEQEEFYQKGWLKGIEIVNGTDYDPIAHQWCLDKQLTMIGNSDVHNPIHLDYDFSQGTLRPMTLVFAKDRSEPAIKEALLARRTVVYCNNALIGEAQYLQPLFERSIEIKNPAVSIKGKGRALLQIHNKSALHFELQRNGKVAEVSLPEKLTLYSSKTSLLAIQGNSEKLSGEQYLKLPYKVQNLKAAPGKGLPVELMVKVTFTPKD